MLVAGAIYSIFALSIVVVSVERGMALYRFTETLLAVTGYCALVGAIFYQNGRSTVPGAVFSSLVVAWLISVGFIHY
jgi:hypothetical protein